MWDKRIAKYLQKIERAEAMNYTAFLSLLPENLREEVQLSAVTRFKERGAEVVDISDKELLERLNALTVAPNNRVDASLQGDSHSVNVSTSYLLAYHQNTPDVHPDTIVCDESEAYFRFQPKRQLVIIENAALFFAKQTLFTQMNKAFSLNLSFEQTDLVFGAGNQVSNEYNFQFINQYDTILCFFDYDLGGLKIFKAMRNKFGHKVKFLEPVSDNLERFFVKKPKNQQHYLKALEYAENFGLNKLHQLFEAKQSFMEQEALLAL